MTNKEFYREFGNIDPKLIEAAAPVEKVQKKKKNGWMKWASLAACFCFVFVGVFIIQYFNNKQFEIPPTVQFNNAEYVICGSEGEASILEQVNLPSVITKELAGEKIAYLSVDGNAFSITQKNTKFVLYEYAPSPNENVYIVLIEDEYYAAIRHDANGYHGITE